MRHIQTDGVLLPMVMHQKEVLILAVIPFDHNTVKFVTVRPRLVTHLDVLGPHAYFLVQFPV